MKLITTYIALMLCLSLAATTWEVKQDGSGHFTHIQDAIDAATHGDSIKVFPGTYVENIDYIGKNIFIYSLEYTTGNPAYRDSTIIDGNRNGSVVKSVTATTNCGINGFTIQNGSGDVDLISLGTSYTRGGGFRIRNAASFGISACTVQDNLCNDGGGLFVKDSIVYLHSSTIKDNFATLGGGMYIGGWGRVIFDQIQRSSVYNNIAGYGQDILASETRLDLDIYLDMATLNYRNSYYISYDKSIPTYPGNLLNCDIIRGYLMEVDADLYVSPEGSDDNDGLSSVNALKSIFRAFQVIKSDSLCPNTIHLAPGEYASVDNQFYPLGLKSYVTLHGAGTGVTILQNSQNASTLIGQFLSNSQVQGFSVVHNGNHIANHSILLLTSKDCTIADVDIQCTISPTNGGILFGSNSFNPSNCLIDNVKLDSINSTLGSVFYAVAVDMNVNELSMKNCTVRGTGQDYPSSLFTFSGNRLQISNSVFMGNLVIDNDPNIISIGIVGDESTKELKLDSVLIANNQTAGAPPVFIAAFNDNPGIINNCTFANNSGANFAVQLNGNFEVNNCIFDNDTQAEIKSMGSTSQIDFNNNFIRNYPASTSFEAVNNISFNDVVLSGEPGFCSSLASDPLSYRLANNSICRDMGTPDTLGLSLPETDLAGNPRIYGAAIDLGCYEWNYPVGVSDMLSPQALELRSFPNPFSAQHTVLLNLKRNAYLNCDIYNLRGQKVRSLADSAVGSGEQMLVWDGRDDDGKLLGSGIYFMRMQLDGKAIAVRRLVLAK